MDVRDPNVLTCDELDEYYRFYVESGSDPLGLFSYDDFEDDGLSSLARRYGLNTPS